jgi:hypothetical protein
MDLYGLLEIKEEEFNMDILISDQNRNYGYILQDSLDCPGHQHTAYDLRIARKM